MLSTLTDNIRLKASIFWYNYRWTQFVDVIDGLLPRCAAVIPILGYAIIFNDAVASKMTFNQLADQAVAGWHLTSSQRLKFWYVGFCLLGASNIVYRLRRPYVLVLGRTQIEFINTGLAIFTIDTYIDIHGQIRSKGHYTMHGKYYDKEFEAFKALALGGPDTTAHWGEAKSRFESLLRSMLIEHYTRNDVSRRSSLTLALALSLMGYGLFLYPSLELFVRVIAVIAEPLA